MEMDIIPLYTKLDLAFRTMCGATVLFSVCKKFGQVAEKLIVFD